MPLAMWLMLGGITAYLVYQGGKTAAQTAASSSAALPSGLSPAGVLNVTAANGQSYSVPVDANLPASVAQQIQTFFGTAGQTDATVLALSNSLAAQGYTVAAGSVQSVWQMVQAAQGMTASGTPSDSSGASGGGGGGGGGGMGFHNPFHPASSSSASPPTVLSRAAVQNVLTKIAGG